MKHYLLALLAATSFSIGQSFAQCNMIIPSAPGHVQISADTTLDAIGTIYWVCEGVNVTVNSSTGATFYLEEFATITVDSSDGDEVHAKDSCVVTNNSSQDIAVTVNTASVALNNNASGTITIAFNCGAVTYDYQFVGGAPCIGQGVGVAENDRAAAIRLFPNPTDGVFFVEFNSTTLLTKEVFDVLGRPVVSTQASQIDLSEQPDGLYFVRIATPEGTVTKNVLVK